MSNFKARIVLLGASNVTKGISTILGTAQRLLGSPLDVRCAIGHGRSYGARSTVLVRSLPGILESHLWQTLEDDDPLPTYGLIADIGNDVMYGSPPTQIGQWINQCITRLRAHDARIVMTSLPLARIERLNELHYSIARSLLFPSRSMTFEQAKERARAVHGELEVLAANHDLPLVEMPGSWYGVDPIHIRARCKASAWREILSHWVDDAQHVQRAAGSLRRWMKLRAASPEQWWLLGTERGRQQPAVTLDDGTTVSLY